ncbi:type II toxin-antitoxin system VapC family toxin [Pseudomonas sp. 3A(2025)]
MYLLDTSVIAELRKPKPDPHVMHWASRQPPASLFISAITVMELETGVLRAEQRDASQGRQLRHWLESQVLVSFNRRILPIDTAVSRRCAPLLASDSQSDCNALIAATALANGLTLVTRDVADFQHCAVPVLNPWVSQLNEDRPRYAPV